ncbi:MAG: MFS transporter [Eubacteriales bacterium]
MLKSPIFLTSLLNFLLNFAIQGSLIFIPLLGAQLGASDFQVGLIGAAYGGAYLLSSLYSGRQSDRWGKLIFVRAGLLLCSLTFVGQMLAHHYFTLTVIRAGVGLALGVTSAALVAHAFESGADMGRFSSFGSLGWIAGALAAALLKKIELLFAVSAVCCVVAFIISMVLTAEAGVKPGQARKSPPSLTGSLKSGFPIYLAVFLRHLGATAVWIILPLYLTSIGIDRFWIAVLWSINFTVQFVVMRFLEPFNANRVFALGQLMSIMVFVAYALARSLWSLVIVQALLGAAWSFLYVGALLLVLRSGEDRGTSSGIFQSTLNLCGVVGPFLGGAIAQVWSYQGVMFFAAAIGAAGLMVAVPQNRQQNQAG